MRNRIRLSDAHREIETRKGEVCESCPTLLEDDQKRFCKPCGEYWDDVSKGVFDKDRNR